MNKNNFVSGGKPGYYGQCWNCVFLEKGKDRDGGWCTNSENRVAPSSGWPNGFTPSVASSGGCDLHTKVKRT
jgi:hypothetical protein